MSIQVTSTTDSQEAVTASMADLAEKPVVAEKAAAAPETEKAEKLEASETPNEEETESEENEKDEKPEDQPKKKGGFQKKIGKLTKQRESARQEAEYWRAEALKNQKPTAEKTASEVTKPVDASAKPKSEDFDSHEAYAEALTDWKVDQKLIARDRESKATEIKAEQKKQVDTHWSRVETFKKDHSDFDEAIEGIDDIPMSLAVQQVILESENGAELMYQLAKNREEYERICKLPAIQAAKELGKFEARTLKPSESPKEPIKTTKAPAPIKPVGGKGTGSGKKSIDDPTLTQREYEKLREEQLAQRA